MDSIQEIHVKQYLRVEGQPDAAPTDKVFKGSDGIMYSALEMQALMSEAWSNNACLGYIIQALEELETPEDEIKKIVQRVKGKFDWTTVDEAAEHYRHSRY